MQRKQKERKEGKYGKVQHSYTHTTTTKNENSSDNRNPQMQQTRDKVNKQIDELSRRLGRHNIEKYDTKDTFGYDNHLGNAPWGYHTRDRQLFRLPCIKKLATDTNTIEKDIIIIGDSQTQSRDSKHNTFLPPKSVSLSFGGMSTLDFLWLLTKDYVTTRNSRNFNTTHNPFSDNPQAPVSECAPLQNFMDYAKESTQNFTQFTCRWCRANCYKSKTLVLSLGTNDFIPDSSHQFPQGQPLLNIKRINSIFSKSGTKVVFLEVPFFIPKSPQRVVNNLHREIEKFNNELVKLNKKNSSPRIRYKTELKNDQIHLSYDTISYVFGQLSKKL